MQGNYTLSQSMDDSERNTLKRNRSTVNHGSLMEDPSDVDGCLSESSGTDCECDDCASGIHCTIDTKDMKLCQDCHGYFDSDYYYYKHLKMCQVLFGDGQVIDLDRDQIEVAFTDLLSRFHRDEVGMFCKSDTTIRQIGVALFEKHNRMKNTLTQVRRAVSTKMRTVVNLFHEFLQNAKNESLSLKDMFKLQHFPSLEEAVHSIASSDGGSLKSGLLLTIGNLLKSCAIILQGKYLINRQDDEADSIDKFLEIVEDFEYQLMQNCQIKHLLIEHYLGDWDIQNCEGINNICKPLLMQK